MDFRELAKKVAADLGDVPRAWDGKQSILEMRNCGNRQWKQMEWIGFYFQFLCERYLSSIMQIPGPRYGNPQFDGLLEIPWDFKAHAINTSSHHVIVNDSRAIAEAIADFGAVGLVLALGKVEYNDEERSFQKWHNALKGGMSSYEAHRIARGAWSRLRKVEFRLQQIALVRITDDTLVKCGSFQQDFRNSDGSPRNAKLLLDLEQLDENAVHFLDFP
jgi:hypothetical protein